MQDDDWLRVLGVAFLGLYVPPLSVFALVAAFMLRRRHFLFGAVAALVAVNLLALFVPLSWQHSMLVSGLVIGAAALLAGVAAFLVRQGHPAGTCALVAGGVLALNSVVVAWTGLEPWSLVGRPVAVVGLLALPVLAGSLFVLGTAWREARAPPDYLRAV